MGKTINTFTKLNQDLAKNKVDQKVYYDALNVRLVTDDGLSSGAITNTRGTKISFKLPDLPTYTYEQDSQEGAVVIPALNNLVIIGWCNINNKIVLFTKHQQISKVRYNQIWLLEFDESTDEIIGLNNGFLVPSTHLKYNRQLNIDKKVKCFGIAESEKFMRVYWTDTQSSLMGINLLNPDCLNIPQRTLPINSKVDMTVPFVDELGLGNLPNGCIQYFYRLIHKDGAITNFSPLSNLFQLNNGNEEGEWKDYPAIALDRFNDTQENKEQARLDESSENGCLVKVTDIDKDYDYIQLGYVIWKQKDLPLFYILPIQPIQVNSVTNNKHFTYYHDGSEPQTIITQEEFNKLVTVWDSCYTMETKDNTLYVANTTSGQFDIDILADELNQPVKWDARAYRFDSSKVCNIYRADGVLEASFVYPNYPAQFTEYTFDAINPDSTAHENNPVPYNNTYKYNPSYANAGQYRLGGIGPNVNYIFTNNSMVVDTDIVDNYDSIFLPILGDQSKQFTFQNKKDVKKGLPLTKVPDASTSTIGIPSSVQSSTTDRQNKSWSDFKNPYLSSKIATHQHGEIYRYWITFYNKKNQPSFAKWIADIKTPEFNDSDYANVYKLSDFQSSNMTVQTMGIEFTVNIPTWLANEITGFSIGRTERQEEDKTKLGTGITGRFYNHGTNVLTWDSFKYAFTGIAEEFISRMFNNNAGLLNIVGSVANKLIEIITDTIDNLNGGTRLSFTKNMTEEDLRSFIKAAFDSSGSSSVKLFGPLLERLTENIAVFLFEIIKSKIGWIDEETYDLGGSFGDTNIHPSTIYTINPAHQFDKYHYKTGDYINLIQKFRLEKSGSGNSIQFTQDKFVDSIHRYTNTGMLNRTDSTACLRKWYKGQTASGTYTIDKEISLDEGDIVKSNFLSDGTTGTFINSYIGYMERYSGLNKLYGSKTIDDNFDNYTERRTAWDAVRIANQKLKVMGLGDKKQLLKLNSNFITPNFNSVMLDVDNTYGGVDESASSYQVINCLVDSSSLADMVTYDPSMIYSDGLIRDFPGRTNDESSDVSKIRFWYENNNIKKPRYLDTDGDCIISYNRIVQKQYGGSSVTERNNNIVIEVSYVKTTDSAKIYSISPVGDSYVGLFAAVNYNYYFEQFGPYEPAHRTKKAMIEIFPTEQSFNFNLREGRHVFNSLSTADLDTTEQKVKRQLRRAKRRARRTGIDEEALKKLVLPKRFIFDEFKFDDVYTQERNAKLLIPKPTINTFVENNPNRIWKSKPKQNGELIDSFREFKALDYLDVEANRGQIRDLISFNSKLFFLQDTAVGIATTNEKSAAATSTGTFTLISSTPLQRYDYISKESGTNQRFSTVITDSFLSYFDSNKKKLILLSDGLKPLSDIEGLSGHFRTNTTSEYLTSDDIVCGGYFPEYNTLFYSFNGDNSYTISYNLLQQGFESFHSSNTDFYLKMNNRLLITNTDEGHQLYKGDRGNIFGEEKDSYITFITNENPSLFKTFNNLSFFSEVYDTNGNNLTAETINRIQCTNDYQDTGLISLQVSNGVLYTDPTNRIKRFNREWKLDIPRDINNPAYTSIKPRMKDNYIKTKLSFSNNNDKKIILQDIVTEYTNN
jgi:hypothetical protein